MTSPDILDIVPEHVVDPVRRASKAARLGTALGDGLLSLLLNAAVVVWLAGIGWPHPPADAPQAISVDLVDHMPGTKIAGAKNEGGSTGSSTAVPSHGEGEKEKTAAVEPAKTPDPAQTPQPEAAAPPQPPSQAPITDQAQAAPPRLATAAAKPPPVPAPAVPPPPEHPDDTPQPRLVEAPAPPRAAQTQAEARQKPIVVPDEHHQAIPAAGPPPAQPKVVSADDAEATVPNVTPPPPMPPALTAEQKRQADNTATLAAVLPFGTSVSTDPFRAQMSAQGQAMNDAYRGAVYDSFNTKAADIQDDARARHLKGTVVVAFSVDDAGNLANSSVALTSGQPEVDQLAMEMIRRAAPFPAPPPGAQRSFSTALTFGSNE